MLVLLLSQLRKSQATTLSRTYYKHWHLGTWAHMSQHANTAVGLRHCTVGDLLAGTFKRVILLLFVLPVAV